jgi:hypothetical protein
MLLRPSLDESILVQNPCHCSMGEEGRGKVYCARRRNSLSISRTKQQTSCERRTRRAHRRCCTMSNRKPSHVDCAQSSGIAPVASSLRRLLPRGNRLSPPASASAPWTSAMSSSIMSVAVPGLTLIPSAPLPCAISFDIPSSFPRGPLPCRGDQCRSRSLPKIRNPEARSICCPTRGDDGAFLGRRWPRSSLSGPGGGLCSLLSFLPLAEVAMLDRPLFRTSF